MTIPTVLGLPMGALLAVLMFWAIGAFLAILVGRDALHRDVEAPWAWSLATLFSWVAGIVYLFLRDELARRPVPRHGEAN